MKRGQVWIETIIYTLIALALIGLVLAYAKPKIEELRDKTIIEQSKEILEGIDSKIREVKSQGVGNKREIKVEINKGNLNIDGVNDKIYFEIESKYEYSESGENISYGDNLIIITEKKGSLNNVKLILDYTDYNITYNGEEELKQIGKSSVPYQIFISNKNENGESTQIDFEVD